MAYRNKEEEKANKKEYHKKNREHLIAVARKWNLEHPEQVKAAREKYKAKLRKGRVNTELSKKRQEAGRIGGRISAQRREEARQKGGVYGISN